MRIPKRLQIGAITWRVQYANLGKRTHGSTSFNRATIELSNRLRHKRHRQLRDHTFMHELLHATAGSMGWRRVNEDEERIDALALLLLQAFESAEF